MDTKDLEEKIKLEKNAILISEFGYNDKKYVKVFKNNNTGICYCFYEIDNDKILDILDKNILNYLEENYNINEDVNY